MLQSAPYPKRTIERCRCKRNCSDWKTSGRFLRLHLVGATGPWRGFNRGLVLAEYENAGLCSWTGSDWLNPWDHSEGIYNAEVHRLLTTGQGTPNTFTAIISAQSEVWACTTPFFSRFFQEVETEQIDCRRLPDPLIADFTVTANGGCDPSAYALGEKLFMRWLAFEEFD